MKNTYTFLTLALLIISISSTAQVTGTFTDARDGKVYKTVTIGTQTWFAENLAYKTTDGCLVYDNDINNLATYGYLYNWETAKKACPAGWHIPSNEEWKTLVLYLGGQGAAGKLMEKGKTHWVSPLIIADNSSGFTALPGGIYKMFSNAEAYAGKGKECNFCTSTEWGATSTFLWTITESSFDLKSYGTSKKSMLSVRLIKD